MAYVDGLLGADERIIISERRHLLFLIGRLALYVLGAVVLIVAGVWIARSYTQIGGILVGLLALIPLGIALVRFLQWHREQYVVTNYRIVQIEGILNKRVNDSSLDRVNDILLTQSVMGRLFGYGTLEILTATELGVNRLDAVADPFRFKRAIIDARNQSGRQERGALPAEPADVTRLLAALTELRNAELLTESEFQEKRARLIGSSTPR